MKWEGIGTNRKWEEIENKKKQKLGKAGYGKKSEIGRNWK